MTSNSPISRFENFARLLIEGSVDRLLRQPGPLSEVVSGLVEAAEQSQRDNLTSNQYTVKVHPDTLDELSRQSTDLPALTEGILARYGQQNQLVFAGDLKVEFEVDPSIEKGRAIVSAQREAAEDEATAVLALVSAEDDAHRRSGAGRKKVSTAPLKMTEAYLIVNGRRHVALDKAVNSIGRSLENDIVLEDPGVSRTHAQIRWRNGRFEIFDVGSRSGTLLNGRPLTRSALKSGDVITLGAAAVIYGEEDSGQDQGESGKGRSLDITQELSPDDLS